MHQTSSTMNKFSELCRLCATYQTAKIDIFSENGKKRKLKEKIHSCLPLQISESDNLPRYLCFKCVFNLDNFYTFRKSCVEAVNMLKVFAAQALEMKTKAQQHQHQSQTNASLSMVHTMLPQVSITLKTVDSESDLSDMMLKPAAVIMSNGGGDSKMNNILSGGGDNSLTVEPILNGQDEHGGEKERSRGDEEEEDDDMSYDPMNFLELNVESHHDDGHEVSVNSRQGAREDHNGGNNRPSNSSSGSQDSTNRCPLCGQRFPTRTHLLLHTSTQHGLPSFVGDESVEITPQLSLPPARPHSCDLCGKTYTLAKHLWGHVKSAHQGHPNVTCNVCGRTFSSIANLAEHKRSRHGIINSSTPQSPSPSQFSSSSLLNNTLKRALEAVVLASNTTPAKIARTSDSSPKTNGKPCMLCAARFPSTDSLNIHIQTEHGIDPTQLGITPISPEPSPSRSSSRDHHSSSSSHHNTPNGNASSGHFPGDADGSVFACEICTREFGDRASLWLHMVHGHKEEAALSCGNCLKVFKDNMSLLKHVEEEHPTMQRRYSCQVCGRQHDSRKKLMKHVSIHNIHDEHGVPVDPGTMINTNNQPRRPPAPSFFTSSSNTSSSPAAGDKSFALACQLCAKLFSSENELLVHIATMHTSGGASSSGGGVVFTPPPPPPSSSSATNPSPLQQQHALAQQSVVQQTPVPQVYQCELCDVTYPTRTERWNHVNEKHGGDEKLTCPQAQCGKVFVSSVLLAEHAAHHAEQGDYPNTCEICGKMWKSRVEYFKHVMGVHPYCLPQVCGICLKIFLSVPDLRDHVKSKHYPLEGDHSCDVCGRSYAKRSKMTRHREIHNVTDEIPLPSSYLVFKPKPDDMKCELCPDLTVDTMDAIKEHRRSEHAMFVCDICPKYYSRSTHLWKHVNRVHKGHPDVTCKICDKVSSSRSHLEKHLEAHDNPNTEVNDPQMNEFGESVHVCHLCQKQFKQNWLLQKHKKTCKGPRRPTSPLPEPDEDGIFRCKKCVKVFVNPDIYKKHLKHSHQKAYCEVCITAPGYDTKVELLSHMKSAHLDNPDYKCDIKGCNKYFRTKVDCSKHCREHKSEQSRCPTNYCNFCADLFTNRKKLWLHLKSTHKTLTACMCHVCFQVEDSVSLLESHVASKHKAILKKAFACRICGRLLGTGVKVSEHIKLHGAHLVNCRVCGSIFKSEPELKSHMEEHSEVPAEVKEQKPRPERRSVQSSNSTSSSGDAKPEDLMVSKRLRTVHTCNLCHRTFRVQGDLLKHKTSEHDIAASETFCFTCDVQFTSPDTFRDHKCDVINKSNDDLNSSTEELNESAGSGSGSGRLRRTWGDDNAPVACDVCEKEWPSRKFLWQHLIRSHKAVAGLACGICLKLSDNYDAMAQHLDEIHPGYFVEEADNRTCEVCGRYHNARPKLESHMAVHTGLPRGKPFLHRCNVGECNFVCRTPSSLAKHIAGHSEEEEKTEETLDEDDEALDEDAIEDDDDEEEGAEDEEEEEDELDELDELEKMEDDGGGSEEDEDEEDVDEMDEDDV
uniref:Zinc finger protein Xfin n=1 Tax=Cacopsylla melanoneura TaxID=428564 RepID=A0A8D9EYM0_9HEMI